MYWSPNLARDLSWWNYFSQLLPVLHISILESLSGSAIFYREILFYSAQPKPSSLLLPVVETSILQSSPFIVKFYFGLLPHYRGWASVEGGPWGQSFLPAKLFSLSGFPLLMSSHFRCLVPISSFISLPTFAKSPIPKCGSPKSFAHIRINTSKRFKKLEVPQIETAGNIWPKGL